MFCLAILVVVALLAKNLVRGAIGREWMAIRDMDVAASRDWHSPHVRQAQRLRRQLLHRGHGRRAVGLCAPGCVGACRVLGGSRPSACCSW